MCLTVFHRERHKNLILGIFLFAVVFSFYLVTLAPTVLWGDQALWAVKAYLLEIDVLPTEHPLFVIINSLFNLLPFGDIAYRHNLVAAFFGALVVVVFFFIALKITRSKLVSFGVALAVSCSHTLWLLSVVGTHKTMTAFFFILPVWLLLLWQEGRNDKYLFVLFFVLGLSIANNAFMLIYTIFYLAGIFYYLKKENGNLWKRLFLIISAFFIGNMFYILLSITYEHRLTLFSWEIVEKAFRQRFNFSILFNSLLKYPFFLFYQFPVFGFLLGLRGIKKDLVSGVDRGIFIFLSAMMIFSILFFSIYGQLKHYYFVFSYLIFAIFIAAGLNSLKNISTKIILIFTMVFLPLLLYYSLPNSIKQLGINLVLTRELPYRDNNRYFLLPDKRKYFGAYRYGKEVLAMLEPGSIIIADHTPWAVLYYFCMVGQMPCKAKIIDSESIDNLSKFIADNIAGHKIYLASLEPRYKIEAIEKEYEVIPAPPIYYLKQK